jgi:hypothetical protein
MLLCPVDFHACTRLPCRLGECAMSKLHPLYLCWDCGDIEPLLSIRGVCAACLRAYGPAQPMLET